MIHFQLFVALRIYSQLRYWMGQLLLLYQHFLHLPFISIFLATPIRYCLFFSICSTPTSLFFKQLLSTVIYSFLLPFFILLTILLFMELFIIFLFTLFLVQIILASLLFFLISLIIFCHLFIIISYPTSFILYFMPNSMLFLDSLTFLVTSFIPFQARLAIF